MKGTIALLFGAAVASPLAQRQSSDCQATVSDAFQIAVVNQTTTAKRDLSRRQLSGDLMVTINNGVLMDQAGRTGYIASNDQFQFDSPPQTGATGTTGWALCGEDLALNGDTTFYQCLSGDFYNLYKDSQGGQCVKIYLQSLANGAAPVSAAGPTTASTAAPATQITDGQPQASTAAAAVTQISDGQIQASTAAAVTQISDGQVQASTGAMAVTQISDGQVQAPTSAAAVTQIADGQVQAPSSAAAVTQISDGQVQATTDAAAPVTQISDGQVQASTAAAVTQIADGQVQAPSGTASATIAMYTGAAGRNMAGSFAFAAGIIGAVAML